jgi:hypothetical protein
MVFVPSIQDAKDLVNSIEGHNFANNNSNFAKSAIVNAATIPVKSKQMICFGCGKAGHVRDDCTNKDKTWFCTCPEVHKSAKSLYEAFKSKKSSILPYSSNSNANFSKFSKKREKLISITINDQLNIPILDIEVFSAFKLSPKCLPDSAIRSSSPHANHKILMGPPGPPDASRIRCTGPPNIGKADGDPHFVPPVAYKIGKIGYQAKVLLDSGASCCMMSSKFFSKISGSSFREVSVDLTFGNNKSQRCNRSTDLYLKVNDEKFPLPLLLTNVLIMETQFDIIMGHNKMRELGLGHLLYKDNPPEVYRDPNTNYFLTNFDSGLINPPLLYLATQGEFSESKVGLDEEFDLEFKSKSENAPDPFPWRVGESNQFDMPIFSENNAFNDQLKTLCMKFKQLFKVSLPINGTKLKKLSILLIENGSAKLKSLPPRRLSPA